MSDTDWRISGAVTDDFTVEQVRASGLQVISQGIGYNLRPVSNVPLEDTGDFLNEETVATGTFMSFIGDWQQGKFHPRGSVCVGEGWQMIANKLTLEYPFPTPVENQEFALGAGYTPVANSDESVIYSGHLYVLNESCWLRQINIWVTQLTPDTNYRVVVVYTTPDEPDEPSTAVIEEPVLTVGAWSLVTLPNRLLAAGTKVLVYIDALNSGADQEVTGGWNYSGQDNTGAPSLSSWNQNNARTIVRIDKTDLDSTNRELELEGITVNSTLVFADTNNPNAFDQYRTTGAPVDQGTYIEYPVVLQEQGEGGVPIGTTTLTATIPISQPTEYAEEAGANPAYTPVTGPDVTVTPFLEFNGVDQNPSNTSFGVDLEFETTTVPVDWDPISYSPP